MVSRIIKIENDLNILVLLREEGTAMVTANDLKEFKFFKDFTDDQLAKLAAMAVMESYEAGTQMYKKGDPARSLFMCLEGKVVMVMDNYMGPHRTPLQITVDIVTKGESMGWSAVVEPYLYTLGALCIDNCRLIALDAAKLRAIMDDDCELGFMVMRATAKVIAGRLTHTRILLVGERGLSHLTDY
jgi:CRP-like cAMP-binding protein